MTRPMIQPTPLLPLYKSGVYALPLRPTEVQARWLQLQYPTGFQPLYFPFPLTSVEVRRLIWQESVIHSPDFLSGLAVELSGLPEPALEALARYMPGEVVPDGWPADAPPRAWLYPDSACIVARPSGEYWAEFVFWSQRPLFHFGRAAERALAFQIDAEVEAENLAAELQQVQVELHEVRQRLAAHEAQTGTAEEPSLVLLTTARPARASSRRRVR